MWVKVRGKKKGVCLINKTLFMIRGERPTKMGKGRIKENSSSSELCCASVLIHTREEVSLYTIYDMTSCKRCRNKGPLVTLLCQTLQSLGLFWSKFIISILF